MQRTKGWVVAAATLALGGCGGGGGSNTTTTPGGNSNSPPPPPPATNQRGTLVGTPSLAESLTAGQLTSDLDANTYGQQLLTLAGGTMACGVDVYHVDYWTVGSTSGTSAPIEDSTALMIPTGSAAQCTGARSIVLDAHGSQSDPAFNSANLDADPIATMSPITQSLILAAIYASQGYIVVAPNYAGYDISTLGYHPYFNADQNSEDMIDALAASKTALSGGLSSSVSYGDKLFVSGYSEGGFVGMATDKALQAAGDTVTATALMSGVYAMEAHYDMVFTGRAGTGVPVLVTTYQNAYGNVYQSQTDIYTAQFISSPASVTALFDNNPPLTGDPAVDSLLQPPTSGPYEGIFGNPYKITDSYRLTYVEDVAAHPDGAVPPGLPGAPLASAPGNALRQDLQLNDMRSWTPQMPMLLCGGHQDETVPYNVNTQAMAAYWSAQVTSGLVKVLDVDSTPTAGDPYAAIETAFEQQLAQNETAMGLVQALSVYHATAIPYCEAAARQFFGSF